MGIQNLNFASWTSPKAREIIKMPGGGLTKPMKLSAELSAIVGEEEASRAQCVKLLWAYLKEKNLQDPENKQFFTPDKTMEGIFGDKRQKCFGMSKHLKEHLTNPNK